LRAFNVVTEKRSLGDPVRTTPQIKPRQLRIVLQQREEMGRSIFPDNQAFTYYDRKKFPRLSFEAGDEPIRAERIDDWLTELDMALSDRMKKFHPGSPMSGLLTKAPLLWGRQYGGVVDWTGDLSVPRSLEIFNTWRGQGRYDGFKKLEELNIKIS